MSDWDTEEAEVPKNEKQGASLDIADALIADLPPAAGSLYAEAITKLIELNAQSETGGWLPIYVGDKKANSVQTGLQAAAKSLNVKIHTRTRDIKGRKAILIAIKRDGDAVDEEE